VSSQLAPLLDKDQPLTAEKRPTPWYGVTGLQRTPHTLALFKPTLDAPTSLCSRIQFFSFLRGPTSAEDAALYLPPPIVAALCPLVWPVPGGQFIGLQHWYLDYNKDGLEATIVYLGAKSICVGCLVRDVTSAQAQRLFDRVDRDIDHSRIAIDHITDTLKIVLGHAFAVPVPPRELGEQPRPAVTPRTVLVVTGSRHSAHDVWGQKGSTADPTAHAASGAATYDATRS